MIYKHVIEYGWLVNSARYIGDDETRLGDQDFACV